jgi:uncharacterized membrane protein
MTSANASHVSGPVEPALFSAIVTPHRSLSSLGFLIVMTAIGAVSFAAGMAFLLDVLLIYLAFRANYRAAAAYEEVTVTAGELRVRKVSHRGKVSEWRLNPLWVRLERVVHDEFGIEHLFLVSRGRRMPVAAFLGPREKESFAAALNKAINEAKRGPTRTVLE